MKTLEELFHEQIQDLYSGEQQILNALPDMIEAASDEELVQALEDHLEETREQKSRLERIADDLGIDPKGVTCQGMKGILKEGSELVSDEVDGDAVRDAAIITACQRVEHYEMAGYGSAHNYAQMLNFEDAADTLEEILDEEKNADATLTRIAKGHVNRMAME